MSGRKFSLLALPLAAAALPMPALAQSAPPPVAAAAKVDPAYLSIYDSVMDGIDMEAITISGTDAIFDGLVRNEPSFADMARRNPQMKAEFRAAALPFMRTWMQRSTAAVRERAAVRFSKVITVADAREIAAFYSSPLGRKFMKAVSKNVSFDNTVDDAIRSPSSSETPKMSQGDVDKTIGGALGSLLESLTPAEREEMVRISQRPFYRKLGLVSQALEGLEQPNMNDFSTEQERTDFQKAVFAVFSKYAS